METAFNNTAPGKQPTDRGAAQPAHLASSALTIEPGAPSRLSQGSKLGHNKSTSVGSRPNMSTTKRENRGQFNTLTPTNNEKPMGAKQPSFSRAVRVSSNPHDMEAKRQLKCLIRNKIDHLNFDPSLCNGQWKQHFQEIMDNSEYKVSI